MKKFFLPATLFLFSLAACVLLIEASTRLYIGLFDRQDVVLVKYDDLLKKAWFKPHPHLIYVFKPDNKFVMDASRGGTFTINSLGFRSTLEYDVKSKDKPPDTLRIATFGGSTTMGLNNDDEIWPYLLGEYLYEYFPDRNIEVLNEGIMGYTSFENLIDLAIRVIDFECDVYVLYLGVNDYLAAAPLEIYRSDHSHFRRTLWESLSFSFVELVPGWCLRSEVVKRILMLLGAQDRRDLLVNTHTGPFRKSFRLEDEERAEVNSKIAQNVVRNVQSMTALIKSHNTDAIILLPSFYHFESPSNIEELNSALHDFAQDSQVIFVDVAKQIPRTEEMTYDYLHFRKEGEKYMARILAKTIKFSIDQKALER